MDEADAIKTVEKICDKDQRYDPDAYFFVREAVSFTAQMLEKPAEGPGKAVSCLELLEGLRSFTLQEFGPMSLTVLKTWGVNRTEDFGEIVFNLVDSGLLGKTEKDRKEDFANGYDFHAAFSKPFKPVTPLPDAAAPQRNRKGTPRRKPGTSSR
jgi:uncharacterized repeat protein (TIGR04138 family)